MKIMITEQNHKDMTRASDRNDWTWDECLKANLSLNNYLDHKLWGNNDWGGQYATFLNDLGYGHQTENGWWSRVAVSTKMLNLFIDLMNEDGDQDGEIEPSEKLQAYYDFISAKNKMREAKEIIMKG
jgi:hypothetical protein